MAVDIRSITTCARFLKNADPEVYTKFIRLIEDYSHELTVAVTEVPLEQMIEARGRAQQARKFVQLLTVREP